VGLSLVMVVKDALPDMHAVLRLLTALDVRRFARSVRMNGEHRQTHALGKIMIWLM